MVALNLFVDPDVKDLIDTYAAKANMPIWAIIEAAIRAGVPGPKGYPANWELPRDNGNTLPGLNHEGDMVADT